MRNALSHIAPALLFGALHLPVQAQAAVSVRPTACVYHEGDAAEWANPNLDEKSWLPLESWPSVSTRTPYYWLRCRFQPAQLAPEIEPVLQVTGDLSYELYVDGEPTGSFGNLVTGDHTVGAIAEYRHSAFKMRAPFVVALRMVFTPQVLATEPMPQLTLGDEETMRGEYSQQVSAAVRARWITWLCSGLIGAAGLFFLSLFWFDRSQIYLLWAALAWLPLAELRVNEFLRAASIPYPSRLEAFLYCVGQIVEFNTILLFFRLANRPVNRFYRVILVLLFSIWVVFLPLAALPLRYEMELRWLLDASPWFGAFLQATFIVGGMSALAAFWPISKLRGSQIIVAFACLLWTATEVPYLIAMFPGVPRIGQFLIFAQQYRTLATLLSVITLTFLLIKRVRQTNRERAVLAGEMHAAQQIQRALVSQSIQTLPGLEIEIAFLPAREVGGDFYNCSLLPGNRQRILLGDVSGKGAAAAMTAAVLIGAAQERENDAPAILLEHLNRVLSGMRLGGFATCLCAELSAGGDLTVANAGHLSPYRNGEEVSLDSCLPLGIAPDATYTESALSLAPTDRLTLLSDGVVEAQSAAGELFGFDRTQAISNQSAEAIAQAAQQHGQQDDITVLTLTFAPAEVLHA